MGFEPTFNIHAGPALSRPSDPPGRRLYDHWEFWPGRLQALAFKAIRRLWPDHDLWRDFPYEYEFDKLAIDVINGSPLLREWVDDPAAAPAGSGRVGGADERAWLDERRAFLHY